MVHCVQLCCLTAVMMPDGSYGAYGSDDVLRTVMAPSGSDDALRAVAENRIHYSLK